jgi:hypothetical protein
MKLIVKNFNNLVKKTIFKVKNKTNNKFIISSFNKYLITFIGLLFFYIFYLLIPLLYGKDWVQNNIENKIFNEFKINTSISNNISYRILPSPHYLIKDSKILIDNTKNAKSIANVRNLKIFFSQRNIFNKKKMNLKKLIIDEANFSLLRNELTVLNNYNNNQFSKKKIKINNSNIFFRDNSDEIITIIKINKAFIFFDNKKKINLFHLKGNIFGVPFIFDHKSKKDSLKNNELKFKARSLKLNIFNESISDNESNTGKNIISFLNSSMKTKYSVKEKLITFKSANSRLNNLIINYSGKLSINPFDLDLNMDLGTYKISHLFNFKSILKESIKTKLLFNDSLSLDLTILTNTNALDSIFQSAKINFNITNGKINLDNTTFINNKIGLLKLSDSNLFLENNELTLNTNILVDITDSKSLFSFLNTNKKSRNDIKNIFINLDYTFLNNVIKFNIVKVNNKDVSDQFLNIIDDFKDNNFNNRNKSRRILNALFKVYKG